ncbi:hypothetical protein STCU_11285 [Strigomonas culicis]|uniref:Uncharacterized protein n=1 Tax=Strigomonas culicis TaxID=28005 RepID=S9UP05_9TRYP|nr:hypothetical protein STCU_11285 [Strigomonas culicis]|eukprot:EPY16421.1 hypothetical protein STCU_11285 [Strigomonas culicis]
MPPTSSNNGNNNTTPTTTSNRAHNSVVMFFFARDKLIFRHPNENPFRLGSASSSSANHATGHSTASTAATTTAVGVLQENSGNASLINTAGSDAWSTTAAPSEAAHGMEDSQRSGATDELSRTTGSSSVRHKTKNKTRSIVHAISAIGAAVGSEGTNNAHPVGNNTTATLPPSTNSYANLLGDSTGAGPQRTMRRMPSAFSMPHIPSNIDLCVMSPTSTVQPPLAAAAPSNASTAATTLSAAAGGGGGSAPREDNTCVGIPPTALLHLLRSCSFCGCATVAVDNLTFLLYPLELQRAAEGPRKKHAKSPAAGKEGGAPAKRAPQRSSHTNQQSALLVFAMERPDTKDGTIAHFVQCLVNVLLREELRSRYIARQIEIMEGLWRRIDRTLVSANAPRGGAAAAALLDSCEWGAADRRRGRRRPDRLAASDEDEEEQEAPFLSSSRGVLQDSGARHEDRTGGSGPR